MNYLAHIYLSGDSDEVMLGNFIGDYVKGSQYLAYPELVAYGIRLHRGIDSFTDNHPDVKECVGLIKPGYGRYSGIVIDVFFDHFLAANWSNYSGVTLRQFAKYAHAVFLSNYLILPTRVKQILPFLIQNRRFESYAKIENIRQVLDIMSRYSSLPANSQWAVGVLENEYDQLVALFRNFFCELIEYVESCFDIKIVLPNNDAL